MNKMRRLFPGSPFPLSNTPLGEQDESSSPLIESPVERLLAERRHNRELRQHLCDPNVVNEQCWAILQELYHAQVLHVSISTAELSQLVGLAESTVDRYLNHLRAYDLVADDKISGTGIPRLSSTGKELMVNYYTGVVIQRRNSPPI